MVRLVHMNERSPVHMHVCMRMRLSAHSRSSEGQHALDVLLKKCYSSYLDECRKASVECSVVKYVGVITDAALPATLFG
ncbi:uncharacterized protein V6R79_004708 [Siganus canaliculatus]